jgi:hypothetical protein
MSDRFDMLEILQADVTALLKNVPALADAVILADNEGDIESKVVRNLAPLTGSKRGLAVVVLLPEITETETNLPGPPVTVEIEIQTIEAVTINRQANAGTGLRSSQAAMIVLNALHHHNTGTCGIYAENDPVTPVKVKPGYVSHAVKLKVAGGMQGPGKPAQVTAEETDDVVYLSCATAGASIWYTIDGSYPTPANGTEYVGGISDLTPGTVLRAAAYKTGLNPGDVTEILIVAPATQPLPTGGLYDGLLAYYKMDDAPAPSGPSIQTDSHGTNDLTGNNSIAILNIAGVGGGIAVAGNAEAYLAGNSPISDISGPWTIVGWFKTSDSSPSGISNILAGGSAYRIGIFDGFFSLILGDGALTGEFGANVTEGAWHQLAIVNDAGGYQQIYVDGTDVYLASEPTLLEGGGGLTIFGDLDCGVDELGFWGRALSGPEIAQLYNSGQSLPYEDFNAPG